MASSPHHLCICLSRSTFTDGASHPGSSAPGPRGSHVKGVSLPGKNSNLQPKSLETQEVFPSASWTDRPKTELKCINQSEAAIQGAV